MKNLKLSMLFLTLIVSAGFSMCYGADVSIPEEDKRTSKANENSNSAVVESNTQESQEVEFQKVISDYREYVSDIPASVRDEVVEYRKAIANLNKEKRTLYRKLSQNAQDYLKKVQEYKNKLPRNKRDMLKDEN